MRVRNLVTQWNARHAVTHGIRLKVTLPDSRADKHSTQSQASGTLGAVSGLYSLNQAIHFPKFFVSLFSKTTIGMTKGISATQQSRDDNYYHYNHPILLCRYPALRGPISRNS
jgi:hypothetical protein